MEVSITKRSDECIRVEFKSEDYEQIALLQDLLTGKETGLITRNINFANVRSDISGSYSNTQNKVYTLVIEGDKSLVNVLNKLTLNMLSIIRLNNCLCNAYELLKDTGRLKDSVRSLKIKIGLAKMLEKAGINTIEDMINTSEKELKARKIRNVGVKYISDIKEALALEGFSLRE